MPLTSSVRMEASLAASLSAESFLEPAGLFRDRNLRHGRLLDFHLEVVDFSRVDELPGVKVGDGFQGGLGLFRVNAVKRPELTGQGVDVLAPSG